MKQLGFESVSLYWWEGETALSATGESDEAVMMRRKEPTGSVSIKLKLVPEFRRQSSDMEENRILSGWQLPRTPPPHVDIVKHLDFCTEDNEDQVEPQQNTEVHVEI